MTSFKALLVEKTDAGQSVGFASFDEADLMEGDVTIAVSHSSVNYKDGLAITGKGPIVRRWPMIPGVDLVGSVLQSRHADFQPGDVVICTGWGLGETHLGAYAERARVRGDWLVKLPSALTAVQAMAIGTAGFTAMLCVMALEKHGLTPANGPAIVTGAAGGVGSVAVALLSRLGWRVVASTGRPEEADYLRGLGADEIVDRAEFQGPAKPLAKERFGAGVDSVGSHTLANLLSMTRYGGAVAACGLVQGMDLPGTVAPFILRNVALLGVDSASTPLARRKEAWGRLAADLDLGTLAGLTRVVPFDDVVAVATEITQGKVRGRVVVEIAG